MSDHAKLSPSGAHRWMACAGSVALEQDMPDNSNEFSEEGTCAHAVAAWCLTEAKPATAYIGRRVDVGRSKTREFTADMVEPVQVYVDTVLAAVEDYKLAGAISVVLEVEQKLPIGHLTGEEGAEGTGDAVIIAVWADHTALIDCRDLKFGRGVKVLAEENQQGMLYTLGAIEKFGLLYDITSAQVVIHQPRIDILPSFWQVSMERLELFAKQVREAARAVQNALAFDDGTPEQFIGEFFSPGEKQCRFCKAKAGCPALAGHVQATVGAEFEVLANIHRADYPAVERKLLPPDEVLPKAMASTDLIEGWCKAVRAEVERRLLGGVPVAGYKLVQGKRGNRAWTDAAEAEKRLKAFRFKREQIYTYTLIGIPAIEGLLKEQPKRWEKIAELITQADGKPSVAPESDKRPPLVIKPVADDFAVEQPEESLT